MENHEGHSETTSSSDKASAPKSKLQEWTETANKHKQHWDDYSKSLSYSLQKSANSKLTRFFYPFFYQQSLLRQKFVKNMQILGEVSSEEFKQFETLSRSYFNQELYNCYRSPNGGFMFIFVAPFVATVFMFAQDFFVPYHPKKFKWLLPGALLFGLSLVMNRVKITKFGDLVNLTNWAIEKRKAEVWLDEENFKVPPLLPFPVLVDDMVKVVVEEKLLNN
jgi:hypothetical protein